MTDDLAVAHRRYPCRGGAERVAETLARTFNTELVTAYAQAEPPEDIDMTVRYDDPLALKVAQHTGKIGYLIREWWNREVWQHVPELHEYDTVVESVVDAPWYVPEDDQTLVRYVHSPHRLAFDRFADLGEDPLKRWFARRIRSAVEPTTDWADLHVCNSDLVARRVRRYWGIPEADVRVVYPPVHVDQYTPTAGDGPYIALSRLAKCKRFDVIIEAFRDLDAECLIVGDGPEREAVERRAADVPNVTVVGYVDAAEKTRLLEDARALVYAAANEDFGMVPIEAFAAGTPVIGPDEGFTKHQVTADETGHLWTPHGDRPDDMAANLRAAVERFERYGVSHGPEELAAIAAQFGPERFRREMRAAVADARARAGVDTSFATTAPETRTEREELVAPVADGGDR